MTASPDGNVVSPAGYAASSVEYAASTAGDAAASPKSWICDTTQQYNKKRHFEMLQHSVFILIKFLYK